MGKIYITGLAVDTLIGVYDWERERLTTLLLDVELDANLDAAMQSDNVDDTINYADVADCITEVGKKQSFYAVRSIWRRGNEQGISHVSGPCHQP